MSLSTLTNTLLDELERTGQLTSQAHTYINRAIRFYRSKNYYFNENTVELSSTASAEYVTLPSDFKTPYNLTIKINSTNWYVLNQRTMQQMDSMYISAATYQGYPQDYAIYNGQLRLGPVPNGGYPITAHYQVSNEELSSTSATNNIADTAPELLIARAGKLMSALILQNPQRAMVFDAAEKEERQAQASLTTQKQLRGFTKRRR